MRWGVVLVALSLASVSGAASAGELNNKTIIADYDTINTICFPEYCKKGTPTKFDNLTYIDSSGRIFDYDRGKKGSIYKNGVWLKEAGGKSRITVRGNTMIFESISDGIGITKIITVSGSKCRVSGSLKGSEYPVTTKIVLRSCKVVEGHQER